MKKRFWAALAALSLLAGCGPAATQEVPVLEPVSPVYTDWSKLTPHSPETAETKYTYFEPYSGSGPLQPSDDYGPLLVYVGADIRVSNYITDRLPLYGLVTSKGQLVTAPVYADIVFSDEFLILYQGNPDGVDGSDSWAEGTYDRTLAAADGSWVRELDGYWPGSCGQGLLVTCGNDGSLTFWNTAGEAAAQFSGSLFHPWFGESFTWGGEGGPWLDWQDGRVVYVTSYNHGDGEQPLRLYLDLTDGTVSDTPPEGYPEELSYEYTESTDQALSLPEYIYLEKIADAVTGRTYYYGCRREDESAVLHYDLLDENGGLVFADISDTGGLLWQPLVRAGLVSNIEDNCFCHYSLENGSLVFRYPLRTNSD